ncbi:MAG: hypothetical protein KKI12_05900, partial [Proteobacteria bacterium]|nr:hypothetical protein [Pseudomonadota bacterium]
LGIYRALSKSQANYSVSFTGSFPFPMVKEGCLQILMGKIKDLAGFRRLEAWKRLCMRLPLWCVGVKPASLMFVAGEKYLIYRKYRRYPINKNTELLQIHGFDYDIYLKEKNNHCIERSIAVFIDEYFPFHPDYLIVKRESPVKADSYYKSINAFFDIVEERTGLEVVIAAHPRATYENLPDYYNGRKCIKGKTINLIRESKLALAHCSTAINFICLFYKPIIFMTCSDLDKSYEGGYIREYAKSFNKVPISIDRNNNIDWKQELMVSKASYDSYRRAYIKAKQSKDLPFWQIVANRLKDGS